MIKVAVMNGIEKNYMKHCYFGCVNTQIHHKSCSLVWGLSTSLKRISNIVIFYTRADSFFLLFQRDDKINLWKSHLLVKIKPKIIDLYVIEKSGKHSICDGKSLTSMIDDLNSKMWQIKIHLLTCKFNQCTNWLEWQIPYLRTFSKITNVPFFFFSQSLSEIWLELQKFFPIKSDDVVATFIKWHHLYIFFIDDTQLWI